jgi:glycerol-3-phosphate dehydrogenase
VDIGIVGGGINGLCCAWQLAKQGHRVNLYERDKLMHATSAASSTLLHEGLRYLENREFRLVREALRERDAWIRRATHLANTLVGTTEVRQALAEKIECSQEEQTYLLDAFAHYFPSIQPRILSTFAGLRPLLRSAQDPNKATREYAIHRIGNLASVFGGKWSTAMALANKVAHAMH